MTFTTPHPELTHDERAALTLVITRIVFTENDKSTPVGKLADVELHFANDLKLIGFGLWERRNGAGLNVTFPARQYSVNGERRSYCLLRPAGTDLLAQDAIRDAIVSAWKRHKASDPEPAARESYAYGRDLSR